MTCATSHVVRPLRIDAHQHFWKLSGGDYGWLKPEMTVLYRDFQPADLKPHLDLHGIDKTILVQAAPTVQETEYLLELASAEDFIGGVVGWLDMEANEFEAQLERLRAFNKFVGLRPMIQDLPDDAWLLRPKVQEGFRILETSGFAFDFLTLPKHLPHVVKVLERFPDLRAVIDHLSKPPIKTKQLQPWQDMMADVAQRPNVMCKLSGMITEADQETWKTADLALYVEHVLDVFGADRVMFGSDWPVCLLAGSYSDVYRALNEIVEPHLGADERAALFGGNAAALYGIN